MKSAFLLIPLFLGFLVLFFSACQSKESNPAQRIVDQAIETHGMDKLDQSVVEFDFRNRHYRATRRGGQFVYERIFEDSLGTIHDSLSNEGFQRRINGEGVELTEERKSAYSNSVNSVIYFALLPYFLNDPAVQKTFLGESQIKGEPYYKVKVTFQADGGGKDHDDEYIYWFHKDNYTMDYLAYNYQVEGGGARFRVAYDQRKVDGILFADYHNLKPADKDNLAVATFDSLYHQDALIHLSEIKSEDIAVELLN
ncbi:MAG TPA: DUF6503 family protein [Saprospiraceae bacterium]|nr:DUF6503 family protein [Saprospiraceae bacterium]